MSIDVETRWQLSEAICRIAQEAGEQIMAIYRQEFDVDTKEFVNQNGEFTVNIALIQDQRPILGVVHAPALGTTYLGVKGKGAFRLTEEARQPIYARPFDGSSLTVVASRSHRDNTTEALLARLPEHEITSVGSSLKFCRVAEGQADLYPRFGQTSEWDTAAAQCVVETAGGRVVDLDRTPLTYNKGDSVLNPGFVVYGDPAHNWAQYLDGLSGDDNPTDTSTPEPSGQ